MRGTLSGKEKILPALLQEPIQEPTKRKEFSFLAREQIRLESCDRIYMLYLGFAWRLV